MISVEGLKTVQEAAQVTELFICWFVFRDESGEREKIAKRQTRHARAPICLQSKFPHAREIIPILRISSIVLFPKDAF